MRLAAVLAVGLAAATPGSAAASPDGALWGAADPSSPNACASCHFGGEAVRDSPALELKGLPDTPRPGGVYDLMLRIDVRHAAVAGFMVTARMGGQGAGEFRTSFEGVESRGSELRSTRGFATDAAIELPFRWSAPGNIDGDVVFFIAANAGNDDASPFGDEVHYKEYTAPAKGE